MQEKNKNIPSLIVIAILGWLVPGGGYFYMRQNFRALVSFVVIVITFLLGIYLGSIAVIDPVNSKPWYFAQILTTPFVAIVGHITTAGGYYVYGRPNEYGQLYTSVAGLLNLFCIINSVYLAYTGTTQMEEEK